MAYEAKGETNAIANKLPKEAREFLYKPQLLIINKANMKSTLHRAVHLDAIGHPILGDDLYAPPEVVAMADRLLLHAQWMSITHPHTGERIEFESTCPF